MEKNQAKFRYLLIYEDMKSKIESGEYAAGTKLKTEKEYQELYQASRDTVRKAFGKLENEDYIVRKAAVGTFVKQKKSDYGLTKLESFTEQMRKRNVVPSSEFISIELSALSNQHILKELHLESSEKCYKIVRIRKGDGQPMAYEINYVPERLCPDIQKHLDDHSSLYEIYEKEYRLKLGHGKVQLEAELPSQKVQESLQITHDSPVLKMECVAFLDSGMPLYYVECYYIGEKYFFSTVMPR